MKINNLMAPYGNSVNYDLFFRVVIESFMPAIMKDARTYTIAITKDITFRFSGDLLGLLDYCNIPRDYHWLVMRINNLNNVNNVDLNLSSLIIPPLDYCDHIRKIYLTKTSI